MSQGSNCDIDCVRAIPTPKWLVLRTGWFGGFEEYSSSPCSVQLGGRIQVTCGRDSHHPIEWYINQMGCEREAKLQQSGLRSGI